MLFTILWAYWTAYKVTTQATPFVLVYGTLPIMLIEFMVPIHRIRNVPKDDIQLAIWVRIKKLVNLDENLLACWRKYEPYSIITKIPTRW